MLNVPKRPESFDFVCSANSSKWEQFLAVAEICSARLCVALIRLSVAPVGNAKCAWDSVTAIGALWV